MEKDKMIKIAERNLHKAKRALENNHNRPGITGQEILNLVDNVEYAQTVYGLIMENIQREEDEDE